MAFSFLSRFARAAGLIGGLAAFLIAGNYCELGAFGSRQAMACAALPGTKTAATHASMPCCSHAAKSGSSKSQSPVASGSCCRAPAAMPKAEALSAPDHAPVMFATPGVILPRIAILEWAGHRAAPDGQPPTPLDRSTLSSRAPPLA